MHHDELSVFQRLASDNWAVREQAFHNVLQDGDRAVATLVKGAAHPAPKVRAACIALMDHLADERCCESLERALHDVSPLVRRHAVHAVGCQRCKVRPLPIDVVGVLVDRVRDDASPRVRRVAAHQLGLQPRDTRAIAALAAVITENRDAGLVSRATHALSLQLAQPEPADSADSPTP